MSSVPLSSGQKRTLAGAAKAYHDQLAADSEAQEYLEARGLLPAIETLRFGVVRSPHPEHASMTGRLAIPFIGPRGNVYDIRFRCIQQHDCKEEHCPKYLGIDGVETRIYNTQALMAPTDYLFVTEGELDAATLVVCGWPAVGIPGAQAFKPHYPRMMAGFSKVVLLADGDKAGKDLASKFRRALPASGVVILWGQGDDTNSVFVREGKEGIQRVLKESDE
jgi:DNA primase